MVEIDYMVIVLKWNYYNYASISVSHPIFFNLRRIFLHHITNPAPSPFAFPLPR